MKKTILLTVVAGLLLAGCTSKEQDEKIRAFWFNQYLRVVLKSVAKNPVTLTKSFPLARKGRKPVVNSPRNKPPLQPARTPDEPTPQVLEVILDEEAFPGIAPYDERVHIKQAWTELQVNNQNTLQDIQSAFGDTVKAKAFDITLSTELQLKQEASTAPDYQTYLARQNEIIAAQDESLKQLMEQNKGSLRRVRTTSDSF